MRKLTKEQLFKKLVELEEELCIANNSTDHWSYEYSQLEKRFNELNASENHIQIFLKGCNIIDYGKVSDFIKSL